MSKRYMYIDLETTGLNYKEDFPTEVAFLVTNEEGEVIKEYQSLIKLPKGVKLPPFIVGLTKITDEVLDTYGKGIKQVEKEIKQVLTEDIIVIAHHASFDLGFLSHHFGINPDKFLCTRVLWNEEDKSKSAKLENIYNRYFDEVIQEHRAMEDVYMLRDIHVKWKEIRTFTEEEFYNRLKETPGRPLNFIPNNAKVTF